MRPPDTDRAWPWVRWFLEEYLPRHRGASPHTISSYRTAFRQFLRFLNQSQGNRQAKSLRLPDLEPSLILSFLSWLESPSGGAVSAATRNLRLAALRSFFHFLELYDASENQARWQRLRLLPAKRQTRPQVDYLERAEMEQVFAQIQAHTAEGFRDLALLALLYNTGARAAEVAGVRCTDLILAPSPQLRLLGKGRSVRTCPLWQLTLTLLLRYMKEFRRTPKSLDETRLFINQRGQPLTRFGIARIVAKYLALAAEHIPSLQHKRLSVHSFRHSTAIHLVEGGAEIHVVRTWLGHRSVRSTDRYLEMNLDTKRDLLSRFMPPTSLVDAAEGQPTSSSDCISDWLDEL